jgi:formylglycine-generating enzyme required for sulfatase activity
MSGNVWEWVQDEWNRDYTGAPTDGSAWENKYSSGRVVRGGGFVGSVVVSIASTVIGWIMPGKD